MRLALVFIFIGWVFFGVGLFISEDDSTVTTQELCIDTEQDIMKCGERLFLEPQGTDTGYTWVNLNFNEAELPYVVCTFDVNNQFFCVNTKTGKTWLPFKKGVIV